MPLIILGLIVLIGLLIYAIINYRQSGKEFDSNSVIRNHRQDYDDDSEENKTLYFPTENIETEKHKRNIH
ncbi:MAG: hypothetical protein KBS68_04630 [Clostridiales bacterium]|nr:hypothetical protein [Candidatus Crickella merdequi]